MTIIDDIERDVPNGTSGPWILETVRTSCGTCHRIGPFPNPLYIGDLKRSSAACVYDDYPPGRGHRHLLANARRISRVPDMEALVLAAAGMAYALQYLEGKCDLPGDERVRREALDAWSATLRAAEGARHDR